MLNGKMSEDDIYEAKMRRQGQKNPATYEAGMGDDDDEFELFGSDDISSGASPFVSGSSPFSSGGSPFSSGGSPFSSGGSPFSSGGVSPLGGAPLGVSPLGSSPLGGSSWGSMPNLGGMPNPYSDPYGQGGQFGAQNQQQPVKPKEDLGDMALETAKKASIYAGNGLKLIVSGFMKKGNWHWGLTKDGSMTSILLGAVALLLGILWRVFISTTGWFIIVGALCAIASGIGVALLVLYFHAADERPDAVSTVQPPMQSFTPTDDFDYDEEDNEDDYGDIFESEEDEDDNEVSDAFSGSLMEMNFNDEPETTTVSVEDAMNSIDGVDRNMLTRGFLYERLTSVLPNCDKKFAARRLIDPDSDEFAFLNASVVKIGKILANGNQTRLDNLPFLDTAYDTAFYYLLEVSRVSWLDVQQFKDELVALFQYDNETREKDTRVHGDGFQSGDVIVIKIMKGSAPAISVKDCFDSIKDSVVDVENYIPVVLGVSRDGKVIWRDLKYVDTLVVTGAPRKGKSWVTKSIIAQMMMWLSPKEVQFYIYDPKGKTSDWRYIQTPHIRGFEYEDEDIVKSLHNMIEREKERRTVLFEEARALNIWDFKKARPDIEMPLIYVVIDELVTLSEQMEKDVKKKFQSMLVRLVTQLPNLGIRLFMIPHVLKDTVIKKTASAMIPFRISVCGLPQDIEAALNISNKEAQLMKLQNIGDMAVKFSDSDAMFVKSAVLATTNEVINEYFEFLRMFWSNMYPETVAGSRAESAENAVMISNALKDELDGLDAISYAPKANAKVNVAAKKSYETSYADYGSDDDNNEIPDEDNNEIPIDDNNEMAIADNDDEYDTDFFEDNEDGSSAYEG